MVNLYTLFVNEDVQMTRKTLQLFLSSEMPGVVIPTTGWGDSAVLAYSDEKGDHEIRDNEAISKFIAQYDSTRSH